ncbi:hypothetical protein [Paracoccus onubensis]|nr:hypothetical protein [Paracoccus onubensis]
MTSLNKAQDKREPMRAVLGRASVEARRLAEDLTALDRTIGRAIQSAGADDLRDLQQADAIRQGLEGLSRFFATLAETTDPAIMCDPAQAIRNVPLRAQAQRLAQTLLQTDTPEDELWDQ